MEGFGEVLVAALLRCPFSGLSLRATAALPGQLVALGPFSLRPS